MKYFKIICWAECPYCIAAKHALIDRSEDFEYCSIDHSLGLLNMYKSNYDYETVPMIIKIDTSTGQEQFIGGYTDLIKYFEQHSPEGEICDTDEEG